LRRKLDGLRANAGELGLFYLSRSAQNAFVLNIGEAQMTPELQQKLEAVLTHFHDALPERHRWRPDDRCRGCARTEHLGAYKALSGRFFVQIIQQHVEHDIPAPAYDDALAMGILAVCIEQRQEFLLDVYDKMWSRDSIELTHDVPFKIAILCAAHELCKND
jgi:hypothetical protein